MARVDDVVINFMQTLDDNRFTLETISRAVRYGFEHGESFGKYGAFIKKQNDNIAETIIQPENDKVWRERLEAIQKDENITNPAWKSEKLLELIAEMVLYRKNGG